LGERALERLTSLGLTATDLHVQLGASVAFTAYERGDLVRARYLIDRVMRQAEELGSARAQGSALWNAAVISAERGEVATALELSEQALLWFHEEGRSRNTARLRNSYAELLLRTDPPRPAQALELLQSARADLLEVGTLTDLAYCETEIARAHLLLGDAPAAVDAAREALHHLPAAEERLERSRALVVLADAWLAADDSDAAEAAYREAGQTLAAAGAGRQAARVWRQLSDHLERRGDVVGALAAMKAASDAVGVPGAGDRLPAER
jgi:tetratricopeptide (TPR) repeat protein